MTIIAKFIADDAGATAIEYALIAALVSVGIIVALNDFTDGLNTLFTFIQDTYLAAYN